MNYSCVDCLVAAVQAAYAALLAPDFTHTIYGPDTLSELGDMANPKRPCIVINTLQAQRQLGLSEEGPRLTRLALDETRVLIGVASRHTVVNEATQEVTAGYIEHKAACAFVRNFILTNHSVPVPDALVPELGDQPLGMRPDAPMDGLSGPDKNGYRHTFYLVVENLEVLWPQ